MENEKVILEHYSSFQSYNYSQKNGCDLVVKTESKYHVFNHIKN